jgi:ribosomal protein L7/L12
MKKFDAEKMITLITNDFNDVDNITAGNLLALLEDSIVDDQRLDEITARNNNRINDCMELVMTLFSKGHVDKIQAIMLVRVLKNVSLVDAKEIVDAWKVSAAPDPIIEVWEMVNSRNDMEGLTVYAEDMWNAIKKYAEGKGKK